MSSLQILGIDHICISCLDITDAHKLNILNYRSAFEEHALPIIDEKKPFLRQRYDFHDAIFLTSPKGLSMELINHHGSRRSEKGRYTVLFECQQEPYNFTKVNNDSIVTIIGKILGFEVQKMLIPALNATCFIRKSDSFSGLSTVILKCKNLKQTSEFWKKGLGFRDKRSIQIGEASCRVLEFPAPRPSWSSDLVLIEEKTLNIQDTYLDDAGWTCLSFIVKDIESSIGSLKNLGTPQYIGQPYLTKINKIPMKLVFLRGPEAELIELMEFQNNK